MRLTLLSGDGLPGINAESFTVTTDDDVIGWVVRHPHAVVGDTKWQASDLGGRVVGRGLSRKEDAAELLEAQ